MNQRISLYTLLVLTTLAGSAVAQSPLNPLRDPQPSSSPARPDQPVYQQVPALERRAATQQPVPQAGPQQSLEEPPPFLLTPQEQAQVDQVLNQWEQHNSKIKTFECRFARFVYDIVFCPPQPGKEPTPKAIELGIIQYAAPDRGLFRVETEKKNAQQNGEEVPIPDARAEHLVCNGKSIFEFKHAEMQFVEHKLPPELQGKAIANTPLPFLFGAEAQKLKDRYWIRIITPKDAQNQVWLEAHPRFKQEKANFKFAQFIINWKDMTPLGLKLVQTNGKDYTNYQFTNIIVDDPFWKRLFKGDPFTPPPPPGWKTLVVDEAANQAQAQSRPNNAQPQPQTQARRTLNDQR